MCFLISMNVCGVANAQVESFVVEDLGAGTPINSLVRYADNLLAVGYYEDNTYSYFLLINISNASITHKVVISTINFYVRDFRVLDDTVYACGTRLDSSRWRGFVMKFHKDLVISGSNGKLNGAKFVDIDSTTELSRMVVYHNNVVGHNEVVAIGYLAVPMGNYYSRHGRIVDCKSAGSAICKVRNCYSTGNQIEYIDDLALTDNYIGFIGNVGGNSTILKKTLRNSSDILSESMLDTVAWYSHSDNEPASMIHATETRGDSIAAAIYAVTSSGTLVTRIRQYDLNGLAMIEAREINMVNKNEPCELAYNHQYSTYLMLERLPYMDSSTHHENQVVTQRPVGTSSVETYCVLKRRMSSIASSPNGHHFMLAGGGTFALKKTWAMSGNSCFEMAKIPYTQLVLDRKMERPFVVTPIGNMVNWIEVGLSPRSLDVEQQCVNN